MKIVRLCAFVIASFFVSSPSYSAAWIEFKCEKGERLQSCAINGRVQFIYIYDEIDSVTFNRIAFFDGLLKADSKFPIVYLNSFGGDLIYARAIGRILRRRSAKVESKNVFYPQQKSFCDSACVLIAAGAVDRQLREIRLHRTRLETRIKGEVYRREANEQGDKEAIDYFSEMGINPRIAEIFSATPYDDLATINYDPSKPHEQQEIVSLGFRMHIEKTDSDSDVTSSISNGEITSSLAFAADRGDAEAAKLLGYSLILGIDGYPKDTTKGLIWLKRAVELGSASAGQWLGVLYYGGKEGVKRDYKKAVHFYSLSAEAGNAGAQNNLGWAYYKGNGVKTNYAEAIYWLTRSAEQGEPFAYSSLGEMYFRRSGFLRNDIETLKWLTLAAAALPRGTAKTKTVRLLAILKNRMSKADIETADTKAANWRPLKQTPFVMRDKND